MAKEFKSVMDNRTGTHINTEYHNEMKKIAKKENKSIRQLYDEVIDVYLQNKEKEKSSNILDNILEDYFSKLDRHLSSMIAKNGIDTSIILMGLLHFLSDEYGQPAKVFLEELKKEGLKYFTNKEDEISFLNKE